jgi:hypothetical protein
MAIIWTDRWTGSPAQHIGPDRYVPGSGTECGAFSGEIHYHVARLRPIDRLRLWLLVISIALAGIAIGIALDRIIIGLQH